jgi:hypothetical protein
MMRSKPSLEACCAGIPMPPAERFHLPPEIPVIPKNLIFRCTPHGHDQILLWRKGTLWFKDHWWSEGDEDETPWERLPTPSENSWRLLRAKLEQLKIWQAKIPEEPERGIGGGGIEFRMFFNYPDRTVRLRGELDEDGWWNWEDASGAQAGKFDRMFRQVARAMERLTGREWFFEEFHETE